MKKICPEWLKSAVFYEIYPSSFFDSNGDGIGDLPGIIAKLDYLVDLGVNAVWLNPCFASTFADGGYDISDYRQVAPRYGSNDDLVRLFKIPGHFGQQLIGRNPDIDGKAQFLPDPLPHIFCRQPRRTP